MYDGCVSIVCRDKTCYRRCNNIDKAGLTPEPRHVYVEFSTWTNLSLKFVLDKRLCMLTCKQVNIASAKCICKTLIA